MTVEHIYYRIKFIPVEDSMSNASDRKENRLILRIIKVTIVLAKNLARLL